MFRQLGSKTRRITTHAVAPIDSPALLEPLVVREPGDIIDIKQMIRNWSTIPAVGFNSILKLPIHKFERTGSRAGDAAVVGDVIVPNTVFGVPLRKDLAFRAYQYHRRALAGYQETMQLHKWEWVGRNAKHRKQLETGKSRMGRRKAPGKYEGVFAHPLRPKDWRENVNRRVIFSALKTMLSAKFAQGQIRVVDSFTIGSHKTKNVSVHFRNLLGNRANSVLCVHQGKNDVNDHFRWSVAHLPQIRRENVHSLNVYLLAKYRELVITEKALQQLIQHIETYPSKRGWLPVAATPDGCVVEPPPVVPGWNSEWNLRRKKLQESEYRGKILNEQRRQWKWSPMLRGALKVPANDRLSGFRVRDETLFKEGTSSSYEFQELFQDDEPLT